MFEVNIYEAIPRFPEFCFKVPVSWKIAEGENWVVIGPNGAGKTLLTDILQQKIALKSGRVEVVADSKAKNYEIIKAIAFRDIYSLTDCRNMYYQQRWNTADAEETPLASVLLQEFSPEKIARYTALFHIEELLEKRIVALSSGELRKFLITRILMTEPRLLILDNPFIGLDLASREVLNEMLCAMHQQRGLQIVLVLSDTGDIPVWTDRVMPVYNKECLSSLSREEFMKAKDLQNLLFPSRSLRDLDLLAEEKTGQDYTVAVKMEEVKVKYGTKTILSHVNWTINKGERWALSGKNGSGKSTLLSLICGDNPQAYANHLVLFDRRRGTGESIWDIKKRIGYLSPDMHTYYLQDIPCGEVVASGFFDSVGLYRKCTEYQIAEALKWMQILDIAYLAERSFLKLSYGEQRLVLLARAFVKDPEFLILDEPLHGLDVSRKAQVKKLIEVMCAYSGKTLIYVTHYDREIPGCVTHYKTLP